MKQYTADKTLISSNPADTLQDRVSKVKDTHAYIQEVQYRTTYALAKS